ncbi:MAG: methionyl-tRNA formyltransferase [Ignavibacteria bacterium]|nr:methionyl-tRNA formyltransferase [Ignavibacteria bacterium]
MKIVFMGTPEFAIPTLETLHKEFGVKLVVTNPDKPAGKGLKLSPPPVKLKAIELGIPIAQPEKLKDETFLRLLEEIAPDIIVVVAFRILPTEVFTKARIASFNVHPSLLPKFRGPAPINWTIINGETKTGITTFILKEEVDAGNIVLQWEYEIPENFTAGDLHDFFAPIAGEIAVQTCKLLASGNYELRKQDDSLATRAPKINPEMCRITWEMEAKQLRNFIHGVSPKPGAWTFLKGKRFKILRCDYLEKEHNFDLGEIHYIDGQFAFSCKNGYILPREVQLEGRKVLKIEEFLRGYRWEG